MMRDRALASPPCAPTDLPCRLPPLHLPCSRPGKDILAALASVQEVPLSQGSNFGCPTSVQGQSLPMRKLPASSQVRDSLKADKGGGTVQRDARSRTLTRNLSVLTRFRPPNADWQKRLLACALGTSSSAGGARLCLIFAALFGRAARLSTDTYWPPRLHGEPSLVLMRLLLPFLAFDFAQTKFPRVLVPSYQA